MLKRQTAEIKDAYAYEHTASYDAAETQTTIALRDKAIDAMGMATVCSRTAFER